MRFKDVYIQILVLSIFETNRGLTILKKPQEYEAESTPKIELLLWRDECPIAESLFVSSNHTSLNGIKTRAARSNFIYFYFVSSSRVSLGVFVIISTILVSANWKFPFFLPFWSCFF